MVKNPPSNAGDVGSISGQGAKIPHAMGQLSPCAATKTQCSQIKKLKKKKTRLSRRLRTTSNTREEQEKKRDSGESETIQRVGENIKKVTNIFREKREDP